VGNTEVPPSLGCGLPSEAKSAQPLVAWVLFGRQYFDATSGRLSNCIDLSPEQFGDERPNPSMTFFDREYLERIHFDVRQSRVYDHVALLSHFVSSVCLKQL
jgi:hypothetical protein